jgi:hypothetical protein
MNKLQIKQVYIAGALTNPQNAAELKSVYEKIADTFQNHQIGSYVPHLFSDPIKHAEMTPQTVWQKDYQEIAKADLLFAYVGTPSLGVGGELEMARENQKPIILWCFKGEKISRLPRGNPAVVEIWEVKDALELIEKLNDYLV